MLCVRIVNGKLNDRLFIKGKAGNSQSFNDLVNSEFKIKCRIIVFYYWFVTAADTILLELSFEILSHDSSFYASCEILLIDPFNVVHSAHIDRYYHTLFFF